MDGIVTTQYTQIFLDAFQPLSLNWKKVVLKNAYDCISQVMESGVTVYTVIKVAGRKVIVKIPSDLITPLSFWAITLYACICELLQLERALIMEIVEGFLTSATSPFSLSRLEFERRLRLFTICI